LIIYQQHANHQHLVFLPHPVWLSILPGKPVGAGVERTWGGDPWVALVPVSPSRMKNQKLRIIAFIEQTC